MKALDNKKNKCIVAAILSFVNAIACSYYMSIGDSVGRYFGTRVYGWNPTCLLVFVLDIILLYRFLDKEVYKNKSRFITSVVLGALFSYTAIWGSFMLYGTNHVFDDAKKIVCGALAPLGFMLLIVPIFSEMIGLVDFLNKVSAVKENKDCKLISGKLSFFDRAESFFIKHQVLYFFAVWLAFLCPFLIVFLVFWPGAFSFDACYQLNNYLTGEMSTHHPLLSTLLVGWSYKLGMCIGNVNLGYSVYTMVQMLVLSSSFAFFMLYLKKRENRRWARIAAFILFFNPVNSYYAVSCVKGVFCAAFLIYAFTFLAMFIENMKGWYYAVLFIVSMVLSCQFRNNMVYALVIGGIVLAFLQKGIKKKIIVFALIIIVFIGNKATTSVLMHSTGAIQNDGYRESMSVPLMCLARVMINHKDEISESEYERLTYFVPEYALDDYSMIISDGIKMCVEEAKLKNETKSFIKLWAKYGLKYPGDYIEQVVALTIGYWYPLDEPYFINGTTQLYETPTIGGVEQVYGRNLTFIDDSLIKWLNVDNGRVQIPLFGWLWRGTLYFWSFIFAFAYAIYARKRYTMMIIIIPFMYMLSCLLGPVSWLRYIYINIAFMPILAYGLFYKMKEK